MWKLNQLTPLWADDFCRFANHTSIFQAIEKSYIRYFERSGRFFVYIINYFVFGNYPDSMPFFNLLNAAIFCFFVYLVFVSAFGRKPKYITDAIYILLIFDLLFVGTSGIGEVALWKSGAVGYLWAGTLELVTLIPFFFFIKERKSPFSKKLLRVGYYLIAFIASTFLEHLSFAVTLIILFIVLEAKIKNKVIPRYLSIATLFHLLGSLLLLFSKGNFIQSSIQHTLPLTETIVNNFELLQPITQGVLGWIFVFFFILALMNPFFVKEMKNSILWSLFGLASMIFLTFVFIPTEQQFVFRIAFHFEILIIIAVVYLARFLPEIPLFKIALSFLLCTNVLGHGMTAYNNSLNIYEQTLQREALIESAKNNHQKLLIVPKISLKYSNSVSEYISKYNYISDITEDPNHWVNACFAHAKNIKGIATPATDHY